MELPTIGRLSSKPQPPEEEQEDDKAWPGGRGDPEIPEERKGKVQRRGRGGLREVDVRRATVE